MILFKKDIQLRFLSLLIIIIVNYLCSWYLLSLFGINGIHPIGFRDSFGLVFPPNWFFLVITLLSLAEFMVLITFFPFKNNHRQMK